MFLFIILIIIIILKAILDALARDPRGSLGMIKQSNIKLYT